MVTAAEHFSMVHVRVSSSNSSINSTAHSYRESSLHLLGGRLKHRDIKVSTHLALGFEGTIVVLHLTLRPKRAYLSTLFIQNIDNVLNHNQP